MENQDITKTGAVGLEGLKGINRHHSIAAQSLNFARNQQRHNVGAYYLNQGYGESTYDEDIPIENLLYSEYAQKNPVVSYDPYTDNTEVYQGSPKSLDNYRGEQQGWATQLGAGIVKGVSTAATTFLDGTVGLLYGFGSSVATGKGSKLFNNEVSNALSEWNKLMEKWLPNYMTEEEQINKESGNWMSNMGTMNFWADTIIKNLGFTVGAYYSGAAWTKAIRGLGLLKSGMSNAVVGSLMSGLNEGRIEANHTYNDIMGSETSAIQKGYNKAKQEIEDTYNDPILKATLLKELQENTAEQLENAKSRAESAGLIDLAINTTFLPIDNFITYGKLYSRGFKKAKLAKNLAESREDASETLFKRALKNADKGLEESYNKIAQRVKGSVDDGFEWNKISKKASVGKGMGTGLLEGNEEMWQQMAQDFSKEYMTPDSPNAYYKALINGRSDIETTDFMSALGNSFMSSYGDPAQWEQFFAGAFNGIIGVPTFGKANNSSANTWLGRGKSIGLSGGAFGNLGVDSELNEKGQEAVDAMNRFTARVRDHKGALVQTNAFNQAMDGYATVGDHKEWQNNADNAMAIAFENFYRTGRLQDFKDLINQDFENMSDEELAKIAEFTNNEDGYTGFINSDGTLMSESKEGREQMRKELIANRDKMLTQMENYKKIWDTINNEFGDRLDDSKKRELTWLYWKAGRFLERHDEIKDKYYPVIRSLRDDINERLTPLTLLVNDENNGLSEKELNEALEEIETLKSINNLLDSINSKSKNGKYTAFKKPISELLTQDLFDELNTNKDINFDNIKQMEADLKDAEALLELKKKFFEKYFEYLKNPNKLDENRANLENEELSNRESKQEKQRSQNISNSSVPSLVSQMKQGIFVEPKNPTSEQKEKIKKAKEILEAEQKINQRVANSNMTSSQKKAAQQMIDKSSELAESLEDFFNTNSEAFFGTEGTLELSPEEQAQMQQIMQTDPQGVQDMLSEMIAQNDEFARQELKELFEAYTNEKGEMEQLTTPDEELAAAMGNASQEELDAALAANGKSKETGADPTERLTPVNSQPTTPSAPKVANKTTESDGKPNSEQEELTIEQENTIEFINSEEDSNSNQSLPKGNGGQNLYWKTNTTQELTARGRKQLGLIPGDHTAYHNSSLDTNNTLHSAIWNYLNSKGAFSRINNGEVGTNSVVRIGYSKALNEATNTMVPLLFIKDSATDSWVVIGDMVSLADGNLAQTFPNYNVITDALNKATTEQGDNVLTDLETHVQSVLLGRPNYSSLNDRRSLNEIADGQEFKLAIATKTPGVIIVDSKKIKNPRTATENKVKAPVQQSPGQPFILVGDATNGYMCVPIRMPKFNLAEADNSAMGREVKRVAEDLNKLEDMSIDEILLLKNDLQALLNFEHLWISESKDGNHWVINYRLPNLPDVYLKYTKDQNVASQFLAQISNKAGYQVDTSRMNNSNRTIQGVPYNNAIGEIATTNLEKEGLHLVNNGLILNYLDANGKEVTATRPKGATKTKSAEALKAEAIMQIIEGQQSHGKLVRPTIDNNYYIINGVRYERVHNVMPDNSVGTMSQQGTLNGIRAKAAGTEVDRIVREFFNAVKDVNYTGDDTKYTNAVKAAVKAAKISSNSALVNGKATNSFLDELVSLALYFAKNNETVYANNLVIGSEFNGVKVAGEIDILTVDDKGDFRIYDMKTSKNSFDKSDYDNPRHYQKHSDRVEHTTQLNFYKRILENEYGAKVVDLNIIPLFVKFQNGLNAKADGSVDPVTKITRLPFIPLDINSNLVNNAIQSHSQAKNKPKVDLNQNEPASLEERIAIMGNSGQGAGIVFGKGETAKIAPSYNDQKLPNRKAVFFENKGKIAINFNMLENRGGGLVIQTYRTSITEAEKQAIANLLENNPPAYANEVAEAIDDILHDKAISTNTIESKVAYYFGDTYIQNIQDGRVIASMFEAIDLLESALGEDVLKEKAKTVNQITYIEAIHDIFYNIRNGYYIGARSASMLAAKLGTYTDEEVNKIVDAIMALHPSEDVFKDDRTQKSNPVSNEGKSLVRQQTIDSLADKSFITDYDENRDLIENLTDEQITTLNETRVSPKAKKSWAAFVNSIDRSKALDVKQIQEAFDNSFGKSKPKVEPTEEQKAVEEAIKTGKEVAKFSEVSEKNQHEKVWDEKSRDRELRRIARIIPGLSQAERVKIVDTIEEVAGKDNPKAWGSYLSGVITLYKNAVAGTAYHEAFHNVVDTILNDSERDNMFTLAREEWGDNHTLLDLEERLAEGFKEYSLLREDASFGQKLKNFFSDLWTDIKHWFGARDSLTSMYSRVYRGKYASRREGQSNNMLRYSANEYERRLQEILNKAPRNSKGRLLAPNGKESNLTERQYAQVRTPEFKEWFGDWEYAYKTGDYSNCSKVVDENGEPLVVYHGGMAGITTFYNQKDNPIYEQTKHQGYSNKDRVGIYFSKSRAIGENYKKQYGKKNGELYEVFLNIRNSKEVSYKETLKNRLIRFGTFGLINRPDVANVRESELSSIYANNDGINHSNGTEYVVFNSNQIKSATDNIGTFSSENDDIRYSRVKESPREEAIRKDMQRFLDNFDIKIQDVEEFGGEVKLFNALERTINARNSEDITEGVGEAIAFMMQHSPMMKELITLRLVTEDPVTAKGFRRALKTKGNYDLKDKIRQRQLNDIYKNPEAKNRYLKDIGQDIAFELRRFYNLEERGNTSDSSDTFLSRVWEVIISFFNKLTPSFKTTIDIISNNTNQIANAAILNDPSIIVSSLSKPGSKSPTTRVDIGQALNENPYEDSIIKTLGNYNIALAGSASIALEGTLFRPKENPLHDIDFNAKGHTKETLDEMFRKEYPNHSHIRTIKDGEKKATETYLIMDEPFTINESGRFFVDEKKNKSYRIYEIVNNNGELLGEYYNSELSVFKPGIKGKFLDFFIGEDSSPYPNKVMNINGNPYLISDYRNAFQAKVDWARDKDIWDYSRFVSNDRSNQLNTFNAKKSMTLKERVQEATVIWGHPAIGKTTYLESHNDILEWDELVNPKRNEFIRNQVDPNHELDTNSPEFKQLRGEYMHTWREHPEYVKFLTDEWNNLVARAKRENKRLFASPAPLLEIGINDFDLIVALPNRVFNERNMQRGGTELGSRGWKQVIDRMLVNIDPNKVVYTDDYFSDFMTKNLGSFSNLSGAQVKALKERGFTEESWSKLNDKQKEYTLECLGVTM